MSISLSKIKLSSLLFWGWYQVMFCRTVWSQMFPWCAFQWGLNGPRTPFCQGMVDCWSAAFTLWFIIHGLQTGSDVQCAEIMGHCNFPFVCLSSGTWVQVLLSVSRARVCLRALKVCVCVCVGDKPFPFLCFVVFHWIKPWKCGYMRWSKTNFPVQQALFYITFSSSLVWRKSKFRDPFLEGVERERVKSEREKERIYMCTNCWRERERERETEREVDSLIIDR